MFLEFINGFAFEGDGDSHKGTVAEICHGCEVAADSAVGVSEFLCTEASGDLLLDFCHVQVTFRLTIGIGHFGASSEAQDIFPVFRETFEQIAGIGARDASALPFDPF